MAQWRLVFWIAVGVLLSTNLLYVLTASGDVQPWNTPETLERKNSIIKFVSLKSLYHLSIKKNHIFIFLHHIYLFGFKFF